MLKIKYNIPLQELEKFGFRVNSDGDYKCDLGDNRSDLVVTDPPYDLETEGGRTDFRRVFLIATKH